MVNINVEYTGDLHCKLTHGPSGNIILTDAPVDNNGKGEFFSPTDMLAGAVGACISTILGIWAKRESIDLSGMSIDITKEMAANPRRIGKLNIKMDVPCKLDEKQKDIFKNVIKTCPVAQSLRTDMEIITEFNFAK